MARTAPILAGLILLTFSIPCESLSQEIPSSVWWFPLGDNEARRENPVATGPQSADDLQIKWRSGMLSGAAEIFVGALTSPGNSREQQILGIRSSKDSIVLLDQRGRIESIFSPTTQEGAETRVVELSGLFDIESKSIISDSRPNTIGIALEKRVTSASREVDRAYSLLIRPDGTVVTRVGITRAEAERLIGYSSVSNQRATLYPVAAYTLPESDSLEVLALLSQEDFVAGLTDGRRDSVINSVRVYRTSYASPTPFLEPVGIPFRIAPRTYGKQPAIRYFPGARQHIFSLATLAYDFRDTIKNALPGSTSRSNEAWPLHLRVPVGNANVSGITDIVDTGLVASGSLFADIIVDRVNGPEPRGIRLAYESMENRAETGPRIRVTEDNQNGAQGVISTGQPEEFDGYDVIATDLDGTTPGSTKDTILVNNPGREFIVSRSITGDPDSIQVLVYRLNERFPINNIALGSFTGQRMRGRIAAAGDLVSDPEDRREILLVSGRRLSVLQLRPYTEEEKLRPFNPELAQPFKLLSSFDLGGTIRDVAIADVEGDGKNDIVASTDEGTYLIGSIVTRPFTFTEEPENSPVLCPDDTITYSWIRASNGGGIPFGIEVEIIGPDGFASRTITDPGVLNNNRLNVPVSSLNLTVDGTYRIVVRDGRLANLSDTGTPFLFRTRDLGALSFDEATAPLPVGSVIRDTLSIRCVDGVVLQSSRDGSSWSNLPEGSGSIEPLATGDSVVVSALLGCDPAVACGDDDQSSGGLFYRLRTPSDSGNAVFVEVALDSLDVRLVPSAIEYTGRVFLTNWDPATIPCSSVRFTLTNGDGAIEDFGSVGRDQREFRFRVPDVISGNVRLCISCDDAEHCLSKSFELLVPEPEDSYYVAPNPFNPHHRGSIEADLVIAYSVDVESEVSIRIVDRSRSLVRTIVTMESRTAGRHRAYWDGTNDNGEMVANGTYFCVIEHSDGRSVVLPLLLTK